MSSRNVVYGIQVEIFRGYSGKMRNIYLHEIEGSANIHFSNLNSKIFLYNEYTNE